MVVEIMVVDSVVADKEKSALMSATQYAREGDGSVEGWMTDNVRRRLATSIRRPQH